MYKRQEGDYALGDKLVLKAGAKAGFLFGTAASDAQWRIEHAWQDVYFEDNIKVVETDWDSWSIEMPHLATDPVQINTYDLLSLIHIYHRAHTFRRRPPAAR